LGASHFGKFVVPTLHTGILLAFSNYREQDAPTTIVKSNCIKHDLLRRGIVLSDQVQVDECSHTSKSCRLGWGTKPNKQSSYQDGL